MIGSFMTMPQTHAFDLTQDLVRSLEPAPAHRNNRVKARPRATWRASKYTPGAAAILAVGGVPMYGDGLRPT